MKSHGAESSLKPVVVTAATDCHTHRSACEVQVMSDLQTANMWVQNSVITMRQAMPLSPCR
eukprot:2630189-Amphidinium_carterae.2